MIRHIVSFHGFARCIRLRHHSRIVSSSSPFTVTHSSLTPQEGNMKENMGERGEKSDNYKDTVEKSKVSGRKGNIVSEVFTSLQETNKISLMKTIKSASSVDALLSTSKSPQFSRYHALQVVSILSDWASNKKIKFSDFESDPRFVQMCYLLGQKSSAVASTSHDIAAVLGITGDDETAKLVSRISVPQMIRVMSTLATKKHRSPQLLRALAKHISCSSEKLNMKEGADILYAMSVLNFLDDDLLAKISSDLCSCLPNNEVPAVVGSVLTSLGVLRLKNIVLLDTLINWIQDNYSTCRVQDLVALLLTLASVDYHPDCEDLYKKVLRALNLLVTEKPNVWLDVVWALVVLNIAEIKHYESVLNPNFVKSLTKHLGVTNLPVSSLIKLLNINAAAKFTNIYSGPFVPDTPEFEVKLRRSQAKQMLVESVMDSLTNLLPSGTHLKTDVNTGFGFLIDGECALDTKCNPLPLENLESVSTKKFRIAVLVCDYHDTCRGRLDLAGPAALSVRLLEKMGYKVMMVPHTEFNPRERLVVRVKYLEKRLKTLVAANI